MPSESFDEALRLGNDHDFGNGSAIFTRDGDTAQAFLSASAPALSGSTSPIPVPTAFQSFGGWKRSLFNDHHVHGPEGVRFCIRLKPATVRWPGGMRAAVGFITPTLE